MRRWLRNGFTLLLALALTAAFGITAAADTAAAEGTATDVTAADGTDSSGAAADSAEAIRYTFDCGVIGFDERFAAIFDALGETYAMGEEPNIEGAMEYHLPANVYAKVLPYEGNVENVLLFLPLEYAENQSFLWQYAAFMAAAVGDIPAGTWAVLLLEATNLKLDTEEPELTAFTAGNLLMICQTDPDENMLYAILERKEYEPQEPMDGSFSTSAAQTFGAGV